MNWIRTKKLFILQRLCYIGLLYALIGKAHHKCPSVMVVVVVEQVVVVVQSIVIISLQIAKFRMPIIKSKTHTRCVQTKK